ncbi:MAG TPA: NAD(P)/FAD-dependent oxidoreductase [Acidimicrobiales bacterium]|nr:NAD(P)/FAD-dependent oxidoreductase [Acidimicrobiales bacterium]
MTVNAREFDVIVIGAGPTGENVAARATKGGLSSVIVESELVGGECSYWACMPSKALLRPVTAVAEAKRVAGAREAVTGAIDVAAVFERRDRFTHNWEDSSQVDWLNGAHIDLVRGQGRLVGKKKVEVSSGDGTVALSARHAVVIATGSEPAVPPVPGLRAAKPWVPRDATSAKKVPPALVVLGGGVAGCELAQVFRALGSQVTIVEMATRLLVSHEPFVGDLLAEAMRAIGVDVRVGVAVKSAARSNGGGKVTLGLGEGAPVEADEVLVAAGRRPRTHDIGLEAVGLEPGNWLDVDDALAVKGVEGDWLYAVGDANGRALLTHQGKYQARICGDGIVARAKGNLDGSAWSKHQATADHVAVPGVVFTDPEVAAVGLSLAKATEDGLRVRAVDFKIGDVAGGSLYGDGYTGCARVVVDEDRRVLVGATFVGAGVSELLHSATVAVVGEVPLERLWHAVPSYPTISEVWLRLLEAYGL